MSLTSMTGFARVAGAEGRWRWVFEAKSVNGRGLELRFRLPPGLDSLEAELRQRAPKVLKRGNVQVTLTLEREAGAPDIRLNREVLDLVLAAATELRERAGLPAPDPASLLALRGVLETGSGEEDEALFAARDNALFASAEALFAALAESRAAEGAALAGLLGEQIGEIGALAEAARAHAAAQPEMLRQRIKQQIALVMDSAAGLSEERLAQELALIAVKSDVREEIDRLRLHVTTAQELMRAGEAVGRKLDFLSQELNREANTLCSKAADVGLTRIGLDLKTVIDRFREQVQNVE